MDKPASEFQKQYSYHASYNIPFKESFSSQKFVELAIYKC